MDLKSTPIFLVISVISLSLMSHVYAYTDSELTQMYRGSDDNKTLDNIDAALHSGSLRCSDLSPNLHFGYCGNQTIDLSNTQQSQTTTQQTPQSNNPVNLSETLFLLGLVVIIPIFLLVVLIGGHHLSIPKIFIKPKAKKSDIKQYATFIKEDDLDVDMTNLDDNAGVDQIINNYDYHERQKQKPMMKSISTRHKLLLSLGLMKFKKK